MVHARVTSYLQKFSSNDHNRCGAIPNLLILQLCKFYQYFSGRVLYLQQPENIWKLKILAKLQYGYLIEFIWK